MSDLRKKAGTAAQPHSPNVRCDTGVLYLACAFMVASMLPAQAMASEILLHNFKTVQKGADPQAGVTLDAAGNLYGTADGGGTAGRGVVYKLDATGHELVLHSFTGPDGANPYSAGVIRDLAGSLYGTTGNGGAANAGVVYKLDAAGNQTLLHSFTGGSDGGDPWGGLIRDSKGNLYGTTFEGGTAGMGVIFKMDVTGHETVLFSFTGGAAGANPQTGVIRDSEGNLYGTTQTGGAANQGSVYKLDTAGYMTTVYSFKGYGDGYQPFSGVIRDADGNFYGTTHWGGTGDMGTVYTLDAAGQETILYSFTGGADGGWPSAGVIRDSAGNLYGTTQGGGIYNAGVVYRLDTSGHLTVLYSFMGSSDGGQPLAGVVRDSAGNLYGTTEFGGAAGEGVVYRIDPAGRERLLYSFPRGTDGYNPVAGVIADQAGNLYGNTQSGGAANAGIVYKLDATGHETQMYSIPGMFGGANSELIRDPEGNLYWTNQFAGTAKQGTIYELDATGHGIVLYSFTGGTDGGHPLAGLIREPAGNLYGTTVGGGPRGVGVVYKLDTSGNETVIYGFTGGLDGGVPYAGLMRDSAGNLYGTTMSGGTANGGVVYKVDTAGHETVLHSFMGGGDGWAPYAGVVGDGDGNLYGTTTAGGTSGFGIVYKLDVAGQETVLYSFTGGADGAGPIAGVIRDQAGNLYGTTRYGGMGNAGVVYEVDSTGHQMVLHTFTGLDGSNPYSGLKRDSAGTLYGTTEFGGEYGGGVVFEIKPGQPLR